MTSHRCGRGIDHGGRTPTACVIVCLPPTLRTVLRLLVALVVLLSPTGAAAQVTEADFDGGGVCDQLSRGPHAEDLSVLLSHTPHAQRLQLPRPIVRFTTADIDDDGDCDIVATAAGPGLDIFLNLGRGRFRPIHAAPVRQWQTGPRIGAGSAPPESDNASDAPASSAALRPAALRGPSPAVPVTHVATTFAARPVSRGTDLRGPPSLPFSR
jgi:hypothetical protein